MKWDDFSQRIRIKWASSSLSEFDWHYVYEIFQRVMIILGVALVIGLIIRFDDFRAREDRTIYKNIETINPCASTSISPSVPYNTLPPCVRPAGFFDKFSKFFLVVMVFIISICLLDNLPVYDKDDPKSRRTDIHFFVPLLRSEVILIIIVCWLIGLPLNYFLLYIPFSEYNQLWLFLAVSGYIGSYVLLIFYFMSNRRDRALSRFNVTLTNLDAKQVIALMGKPLKIINIESKMIYVYKNAKVIFIKDKVSDVQ